MNECNQLKISIKDKKPNAFIYVHSINANKNCLHFIYSSEFDNLFAFLGLYLLLFLLFNGFAGITHSDITLVFLL